MEGQKDDQVREMLKLVEVMAKKIIIEKKDKATQTPDMAIVIRNFDCKEVDLTFKYERAEENLPKVEVREVKDVNLNTVASVKEDENLVDNDNAVSLPPPLIEKSAVESRVEWFPPAFRTVRDATGFIMTISNAEFKITRQRVTTKSPLGDAELLKGELTLFAVGCRDCLQQGLKRGHKGCKDNLPFPVCYGCSRVGYAKSVCVTPNCRMNFRGNKE